MENEWKPHPSHDMSGWESSIVTLENKSRFGSIRSCKNCFAEHGKTAAGQAAHEELNYPCIELEKRTRLTIAEAPKTPMVALVETFKMV